VVTVVGIQMGHALTGAVFIETVFAYQGMGRLLFDALSYRDYPTLQGCFLVLTVMVVLANAVADLLYTRLDPRVGK
jgi:peptide/nickel transport system permease protein